MLYFPSRVVSRVVSAVSFCIVYRIDRYNGWRRVLVCAPFMRRDQSIDVQGEGRPKNQHHPRESFKGRKATAFKVRSETRLGLSYQNSPQRKPNPYICMVLA